jgi:tetratricopeptide (TPR) repeat protein
MVWRFSWLLKDFDVIERDGIKLWAPRDFLTPPEQEQYLVSGQSAMSELARWFEVAPKLPLAILVFARGADAVRIFGYDAAGLTFARGNSVIVARDHLQRFARPSEIIRHEIAHLLSNDWGPFEPFKGEGLATWLESGDDSRNAEALARLLGQPYARIADLLEPRRWNQDLHYSYAIAGSFTGHLLRRFGKSTYRTFYARARAIGWATTFSDVFGHALIAEERAWRRDLLGRRAEFEPGLSRLMGERRVEALYNAWLFYACLDELRRVRDAGHATGRALELGALASWHLADHEDAAELFEQALTSEPDAPSTERSRWWLRVGMLRDLLNSRAPALDAYRHALGEQPDDETRREAQRLLDEPYRE